LDFISRFSIIVGILAVILVFVLPKKYTATATLLPAAESGFGSLGLLATQFMSIDMITDAHVKENTYSTLYARDIINSRKVLINILQIETRVRPKYSMTEKDMTIYEYLDIEDTLKSIAKLREMIDVNLDGQTGIVRVSVESRRPKLSALIANAIVREFDTVNRENRSYKASILMGHLDARIDEVYEHYMAKQKEYTEYKSSHRGKLSPSAQSKLSDLQSESDILRDLYIALNRERESAEIQFRKETPVLTVLDSAAIPVEKSAPKRRPIVIGVFILGVIVALTIVFLSELFQKKKSMIPQETLDSIDKSLKKIPSSIIFGRKSKDK
jgi:uncharacterized protein involved in exopolysaccharide biosynthesis